MMSIQPFVDRTIAIENINTIIVSTSILLLLAVLHVTNPDIHAFYNEWESELYVQNVETPLARPIDPHYGYRLMPALIIRYMPFDIKTNYLILNYIFLFCSAFLLYKILVYEKIRPVFALSSSCLFLTANSSTKFLLAYSSGQDGMYLFMIAAGYRALQICNLKILVLVLCVGSLNKVSIWMLYFPTLLYKLEFDGTYIRKNWKTLFTKTLTIIPAVAVFVGVRMLWPPTDTGYTFLNDIKGNIYAKLFSESVFLGFPQIIEIPISFYVTYGINAILLIYFWRNTLQSMKENLPMTVFYFAMIGITAVGSSDSARCQVYLFIPVLFFYCRVLELNLDFFRTWQNMFFIVVIQVFNSNLFNLNAALYSDYMPHYMSPETGRSIFYMFMISFTIVVILRVIFLKKRWLFIKN